MTGAEIPIMQILTHLKFYEESRGGQEVWYGVGQSLN